MRLLSPFYWEEGGGERAKVCVCVCVCGTSYQIFKNEGGT